MTANDWPSARRSSIPGVRERVRHSGRADQAGDQLRPSMAGRNPERAAAGLVKVETTTRTTSLADDQLGQLGRGTQLKEAKELLALIEAERQSAGIAIVVHGTDEGGTAEFLAALTRSESALKHFRPGTARPELPASPR